MAVDPEFASVLEAWAEAGERQARAERIAELAAELAGPPGQAIERAMRWARLSTFAPFSSMPFEEGAPDAEPAEHSA